MSTEFSSPARDHSYTGSRKGEEFLVKHMLEKNKTASQILKDTNVIAREATQTGHRGHESAEAITSRSAQMYTKRNSFSKESEGGSLPVPERRPSLTRMKTLENVGTLIDERHDISEEKKWQIRELKETLVEKNRGRGSLEALNLKLAPVELRDSTRQSQALLKSNDNIKKEEYQMTLNGLPVSPLVAQRSAKIDKILQDWEAKLAATEKKLMKDKQAREVLAADLTLMEEELRKTSLKLSTKTDQVEALDALLVDTREAAERITRSMQGLTAALEREKQLKFK
jgi:hypothetical protein